MSAAQNEAPRPEPLRFFGTTWVDRGGGYTARRVGLAVGSLAATAAGAVALFLGYQGLSVAAVGDLISLLIILTFSACSFLAFITTWQGFTRRRGTDPSVERSLQSIRLVGFVGIFFAWFLRSLVEAPGERLHRADYQRESRLHERRRVARSGNPATRNSRARARRG
ncbi:hypothetical protein [Streptomyces sp. TP-A0874]|uniref:hypothetical protein n=1 Tax=Streptomyces sp. TP-A0874 TaxID=549819 RepID=UPI0008537410|nr:hypothetical protein [Streptomyces sp. TP-A0874]